MENLKKNIQDDEIIKWENSQDINYRKKILKSLILGITLVSGLLTLIGLFFWYVPSWEGSFYFLWTDVEIPPPIIYIAIMSIFSAVALIAIAYAAILIKRGLRGMNLQLTDLKQYDQIHVLTNIRWLQKDFRSLLFFDQSKVPSELLAISNDIAFIKLRDIEKATISKVSRFYKIAFEFKCDINGIKYPPFIVKFKLDEYRAVKRLLSDLIPIETK